MHGSLSSLNIDKLFTYKGMAIIYFQIHKCFYNNRPLDFILSK